MRFVACTFDAHAEAILEIFNEAIAHSTAIYDYEPRTTNFMRDWFRMKDEARFPVIGAVEDGRLLGFATYGAFRAWPAYKYSVEHSVYVHRDHRGRGWGLALMRELVREAERRQYHTMIGVIDLANGSSIALHEKLGFRHAGTLEQAGFKFGRWLDVGFYQLILATPDRAFDG